MSIYLSLNHPPVICTIVCKNYLAQARCLTESFLAQHPDGRVFVLLADKIEGCFQPEREAFTTIEVKDLCIRDFQQMTFRYNIMELCTAVKPFFLEYLFEQYGLQQLIYLDPDIYCYQPLTPVLNALDRADVVLTPHLLEPLEKQSSPSELDLLTVGVYNLGFIGLSRSPQLFPLLHWWQQRLHKLCIKDPTRGLFVDQHWADLIPAFYDRVCILRDPTCNVAYWNLSQRQITHDDTRWLVNGQPLIFYHFSGLPIDDLAKITVHWSGRSLQQMPNIRPLLVDYRERLMANGYKNVRALPYAFGKFDNGVPIPDAARCLWRELDGETRWPEPFRAESSDSFFEWLNQDTSAPANAGLLLSNIALEIYRQRIDLHATFPDPLGTHRHAYLEWFVYSGAYDQRLDRAFIDPIQVRMSRSDRASVPDATAIGSVPLQLRCYYAARYLLRRFKLHHLMKRLLGERKILYIYNRIFQNSRQQQPRRSTLPLKTVFSERVSNAKSASAINLFNQREDVGRDD